jgi:hypothetical protein
MEEYSAFSEELSEHDEFVDPDLEILLEEESAGEDGLDLGETAIGESDEEEFEISLDGDGDDEEGLTIDLVEDDEGDISLDFNDAEEEISLDFDNDEEEISLDLSNEEEELVAELSEIEEHSENINEIQPVDSGTAEELEMEIPEELADLSDLAHPASTAELNKVTDLDSLEISLDDLELDMEAEKLVTGKMSSVDQDEIVLSLDEIDFSEALDDSEQEKDIKTKMMDMDADLDFDLDLGGLSIHDDL